MKGRFSRMSHETKPRKFGNDGEKAVQGRGGYRFTTASGSKGEKGDLTRGDLMVEVKTTKFESFRVDADIMAKLKNDSLTMGQEGVLVVNLGNGKQYAVMELDLFERLTPHATEV